MYHQIHFTCDMCNKIDLCVRGTRYLHQCRKYTGYSSKNAQQSIYLQDEKRNADWVNLLFYVPYLLFLRHVGMEKIKS